MSIETLEGVKELAGFDVAVMEELAEMYPAYFDELGVTETRWFDKEIRQKYFIIADREENSVKFKFQSDAIKEVGVNGCQVDVLAHALKHILTKFNEKFPSDYNVEALRGLDITIQALDDRTKSRKARGVEGYNKV